MAEKRRRLFVATQTLLVEGHLWITAGDIAEEGSPILARRPGAFRPIVPRFTAPGAVPAPSPEPAPEPSAEPEP